MSLALIDRVNGFRERLAVSSDHGALTYSELLQVSRHAAGNLLSGKIADLVGERVAFLVPPGPEYPITQWGIWRAGGIAVPLCLAHPEPELDYVVGDCEARILVSTPELAGRLDAIAERRECLLLTTEELRAVSTVELPEVDSHRPAMIVYTSGTTGGPKGVVTTHDNIRAQIESLIEAWGWHADDRILLVLPLHHVHGIINVLGCALWAGATCEMLPRFEASRVWQRLSSRELTLFMAVPTIYSRLVAEWDRAEPETRQDWSAGSSRLRLMVSGSAALPVQLFDRWRDLTGQILLERYGMTEIGMALSNPLKGNRIPGHVGAPLPGVEVRRVGPRGEPIDTNEPGEIEVRGPSVFEHYWGRPEETAGSFREGWFRTGDVAVVDEGSYRILGRQSVDIIKTGGYKVSALEIEEILRQHPQIEECAVVGIADPEWGERVGAAIIAKDQSELTIESLRSWAQQRMAPYKAPSLLLILDDLPRNPMGKVTKPELKKIFPANP